MVLMDSYCLGRKDELQSDSLRHVDNEQKVTVVEQKDNDQLE